MKISLVKLQERLEWIFVFLVLQLSTGAVVTRLNLSMGSEAADNPVLQAAWFGIYLITLCLILARRREFIPILKRDKLLLILVGIAVCSYYWSEVPQLTLRRSVALTGTTFFGIYLVTRYSPSQILRLVVWTLSTGAVLSILSSLALPSYGISFDGAWHGVYQHKNFMGRLMGLNAVLLLIVNSGNRRYRWLLWAGVALCAGLVLLSTSKGALVTLLVLLVVFPLYRSLQWKYTLAVPFLIIVILVIASGAILILENLETIVVDKLGKDLTFTGRTILWELVIEMIKQRPLLGYGYNAFWRGLNGPSAYIVNTANWAVPHAHNGFLDLWLDLGSLGGLVFLLGLLMGVIRAVRWLHLTKKVEDIWPLISITCIFLYNFSESAILKRNDFFWIFYVVAVFSRPVLQSRAKKGDYTSAILN